MGFALRVEDRICRIEQASVTQRVAK